MRTAAAWALDQALATAAPVTAFLEGAASRFDERDQALLRELVLGTLRWVRRLDGIIAAASHRPFASIEAPLRAALRIAAYQILFLERVPAHAAVDEAVELAHRRTHRGGASFVNAVLRRIARAPHLADWPVVDADPVRRLAIETSHPDFLVARWLSRFGEARTRAILDADNHPKPMQLLAFRDRGGRELAAESLIDDGLEVEPSSISPVGLKVRRGNPLSTTAFRRGDVYIQDEASQAAALVPLPRPGERVLDAAAAPGGKGFALLACEPGIDLLLADAAVGRAGLLAANLRRLRRRLPMLVADAREPTLAASFDRVVLDLPCTGTGTLRKHPELKWRISEKEIGRLAELGASMLGGAAPMVASGGMLSVITCSLEREENEEVVARFLATAPDFEPLPLAEALPGGLAEGVEEPGRWRLFPGGDHDGFTVHVLARRDRR